MQNTVSLENVYIVGFNRISLCKHKIKSMYFRRIKNR